MTYEERIKSMTNQQLKEKTYSLYEAIYITEEFGSKDIARLKSCKAELLGRGFDLVEKSTLSIEEV